MLPGHNPIPLPKSPESGHASTTAVATGPASGSVAESSATVLLEQRHQSERLDLRVLSSLRRIIRSVDLHSKELATKTGITAPQLVCLLTLVEHGAITATTISREVFLSPSTVVGILDRLEEKKLVTRERSTKDRRLVTLSVTEEGRRVAAHAPSPLQDTLTEALSALPLNEQIEIAQSLERVVSLMEAQHIDAAPILATGPIVKPQSP